MGPRFYARFQILVVGGQVVQSGISFCPSSLHCITHAFFCSVQFSLLTMQRQSFPPPNAKSPELFHPRPQHISQVPHLRSPPLPNQPQQQPPVNSYGNPYGSPPMQQGGDYGQNLFGGFINDPTTQMASQMGKTAMMAGTQYMEQNVSGNTP